MSLRAKGVSVSAAANLPLTATVVVDAPQATTGQCGEALFPGPSPSPSCTLLGGGSRLACR